MSTKPILFNTEMVKAILDGRKTVTRRLVKPQPTSKIFTGICTESTMRNDKSVGYFYFGNDYGETKEKAKPPYKAGDILYVRETWNHNPLNEYGNEPEKYVYKASYDGHAGEFGWRPSIHMPKEAARIFLKVTDIRIEKVKDITDEEAVKEGFIGDRCFHPGADVYGCTDCMNTGWIEPPTVEFRQTIYGIYPEMTEDSYLWVIEFERISKEDTDAEGN